MSDITVTGQCPKCSWGDRLVVHTTPWCPKFFATAWVDTNSPAPYFIPTWSLSRPVAEGEIVFLFDTGDGEGHPFGTWGRVTRQDEKGNSYVETIGDRWCYVPFPDSKPEGDA